MYIQTPGSYRILFRHMCLPKTLEVSLDELLGKQEDKYNNAKVQQQVRFGRNYFTLEQ